KAYMEGMPGSDCNGGKTDNSATHYSVHHDPFEYFSNIVNTPSRCSLVVPAGSYTGATSCSTNTPSTVASTLISDLGNPSTSPLFAWLTPNNLDNAHDCGAPSTSSLSQPNNWLSVLVPLILNTATFTSDPTATIVVTFDEPSTGTYGSNPLYFVVAGPGAKRAYSSSIKYTHCNTLAMEEANWALGDLAQCDHGVSSMSEFFPLKDFSISASPSSVTTQTGVAGTSTISVTSLNGFQGTVNLSASGTPLCTLNPTSITLGTSGV